MVDSHLVDVRPIFKKPNFKTKLTIEAKDGCTETILIDKCILSNASAYFEGYFARYAEESKQEFQIALPEHISTKIAVDVIKNFYGFDLIYDNWKQHLGNIICLQFFIVAEDKILSELAKLKLPEKDVEKIEMIETLFYYNFPMEDFISKIEIDRENIHLLPELIEKILREKNSENLIKKIGRCIKKNWKMYEKKFEKNGYRKIA